MAKKKPLQIVVDNLLEMMKEVSDEKWIQYFKNMSGQVNFEGHHYKGMNAIVTWVAQMVEKEKGNNALPAWITFSQVKKLGLKAKKGFKTYTLLRPIAIKDKDDKDKILFLRFAYFRVFNICHLEEESLKQMTWRLQDKHDVNVGSEQGKPYLPDCKEFFNIAQKMGIKGIETGDPCYIHDVDIIRLPSQDAIDFNTKNTDYRVVQTAWHELAHAAHSKDRLNGKGTRKNASAGIAEAVVEITAILIMANRGELPESIMKNSAIYIRGWLKQNYDNAKTISQVLSEAFKTKDYILSFA